MMQVLRNPPLYPRNPLRHMDRSLRQRYVLFSLSLVLALAALVLLVLCSSSATRFFSFNWLSTSPVFPDIGRYRPDADRHHVPVTGALTGINHATGERPLRLEISEFLNTGAAVDLYLQCQLRLMSRDISDTLSFFQIAGIHGGPYTAWDGVRGNVTREHGYALHRSVLFPVWHRPYVALYEQIISQCAVELAKEYDVSGRHIYEEAARHLRLPYWDWAANPGVPDIATKPFYTVNTPQGLKNLTNPLHGYSFPESTIPGLLAAGRVHNEDPVIWGSNVTARCPQFSDYNATVASQLQLLNVTQRTYQLFTAIDDKYANFSNIGYWHVHHRISLENVHNAVHMAVGSEVTVDEGADYAHTKLCGHMGGEFAAFDPLFWLHHVNVDRIFALWQAVFPDSYVTPRINDLGTFFQAANMTDTIDSPLLPFFGSDGKVAYTAETARHTRTFGYTYPELLDWEMNEEELRAHVLKSVERLYGRHEAFDEP